MDIKCLNEKAFQKYIKEHERIERYGILPANLIELDLPRGDEFFDELKKLSARFPDITHDLVNSTSDSLKRGLSSALARKNFETIMKAYREKEQKDFISEACASVSQITSYCDYF